MKVGVPENEEIQGKSPHSLYRKSPEQVETRRERRRNRNEFCFGYIFYILTVESISQINNTHSSIHKYNTFDKKRFST